MHTYFVHGLHVRSALELPDLVSSEDENVDVVIHCREQSVHLPDPRDAVGVDEVCEPTPGRFALTVPGLASFLAIEGSEIWVEHAPEVELDAVRSALLGAVLGALLHQRRMLALHTSCVQTPRGAVLFSGASGAGKSSLAGALMKRGYPLLADDLTAVGVSEDGAPTAFPAIPSLRLWADSAAKLKYPLDLHGRPELTLEKYRLDATEFCAEPQPVHAFFCLTPHTGSGIAVESVEPLHRVAYVVNGTYRAGFIDGLGVHDAYFELAMRLARSAEFARVRRPLTAFMLDELVERIEEEIEAV
ncbi:MAG: hypothetical protein MJB57_15195 [Gemmatimonadetes bacterium]|nr:hypothetical protein [Gemmatimonadota bacterium]